MKHLVIAHDLGTTGNKASLYDSEGTLLGSAFEAYETVYAQHGWAEQNPEDWWRAVCHTTKQLLAETSTARDEVAGVSFSGQMMGCVALGRDARPLRHALIWADQRAVAQERWMKERIAPEDAYRITGHRLSSSYSLSKMLWLRDHEPDVFRSTHSFVQAKDAVVARLTGNFVTDRSDASGTNLYDLERGTYSETILQAADFDERKLPELALSTDVVGEILPAIADEFGLPTGTPVVIGGGDGCCAALGAGIWREGGAYNYVGSSSWIAMATKEPVYDPDQRTFTWAHVVPGLFSPCGTMQAAGASYQWAREQLGHVEKEAAVREDVSVYDLLNALAATSPPGAHGLIYLPYLLGERSPRWNADARAAFVGLTMRHTRADMIRSVLEGITMNLRIILDALTRQGIEIHSMRLIGGGAQGAFWNELMADIYDLPVQRLTYLEEATSMGAAVAGGVGVGLYEDFSIIERMNPIARTIEPNPTSQAAYEHLFPVFDETYHALVPIFERLREF